jgi:6-pyruvoyltetrahydropterin/6-carboxytetrahydropterin synthase
MVYQISKEFTFVAGHSLAGLAPGHPCANVHGHNYIVRVVLEHTGVDSTGFVVDYGDLRWFQERLDREFDHKWLGFGQVQVNLADNWQQPVLDINPTAENLAKHFHGLVSEWAKTALTDMKVTIGVSETPKTWAWFDDES